MKGRRGKSKGRKRWIRPVWVLGYMPMEQRRLAPLLLLDFVLLGGETGVCVGRRGGGRRGGRQGAREGVIDERWHCCSAQSS